MFGNVKYEEELKTWQRLSIKSDNHKINSGLFFNSDSTKVIVELSKDFFSYRTYILFERKDTKGYYQSLNLSKGFPNGYERLFQQISLSNDMVFLEPSGVCLSKKDDSWYINFSSIQEKRSNIIMMNKEDFVQIDSLKEGLRIYSNSFALTYCTEERSDSAKRVCVYSVNDIIIYEGLNKIRAFNNSFVKQNQVIGVSGNSGSKSCYHRGQYINEAITWYNLLQSYFVEH